MSIDTSVIEGSSMSGRTLAKVAGLAVLLTALPGCQSITGSPVLSQLRIVDASPDLGAIDVYQGGTALAYNVGFGSSSSYTQISPGVYSVAADTSGSRQQLITASGTFLANSQYTVLFADYAVDLEELILKDQSQPAPSGQISIRILDESFKTGYVDLYLVASGSTLANSQPVAVYQTSNSNTGYINVPTGTYTLVAVTHGVVVSGNTTTLYTGAAISYPGGSARTIVLTDTVTTTVPGINAMILNDYDNPDE